MGHIREVLEMIIEEFEDEGAPLPPHGAEEPVDGISISVTL